MQNITTFVESRQCRVCLKIWFTAILVLFITGSLEMCHHVCSVQYSQWITLFHNGALCVHTF